MGAKGRRARDDERVHVARSGEAQRATDASARAKRYLAWIGEAGSAWRREQEDLIMDEAERVAAEMALDVSRPEMREWCFQEAVRRLGAERWGRAAQPARAPTDADARAKRYLAWMGEYGSAWPREQEDLIMDEAERIAAEKGVDVTSPAMREWCMQEAVRRLGAERLLTRRSRRRRR